MRFGTILDIAFASDFCEGEQSFCASTDGDNY